MGFLSEFREFAVKGNAVDMAVGLVVGAAFGKIVDSLVNDVIMPPIGMLLGQVDFTNIFLVLGDGKVPGPYPSLAAAKQAGAVTLNAGAFINTVISFIIISFCVFLMVKALNKLRTQTPPAPANTKECPECAMTIPLKAKRCPDCTSVLG